MPDCTEPPAYLQRIADTASMDEDQQCLQQLVGTIETMRRWRAGAPEFVTAMNASRCST